MTNDASTANLAFLSVDEVRELHRSQILRCSPTEPQGLRDAGLLESAVLNPQQTFFGSYLYTSFEDMAAAYLVSLGINHAFEQGNKRVAYSACSAFLRRNGFRLTLTQNEAVNLTLRVVSGEIEREAVADIIANAAEPINL